MRITQASKAGIIFYKELDWYANGRIPNSCPTISEDHYIKNSNENGIKLQKCLTVPTSIKTK